MATKKKKRAADLKAKKRKKGTRFLLLSLFAVVGIGFLIVLFLSLSDYIGSPDKSASAKKRERQTVQLYFSDANERFLVPEKRLIPKPSGPEMQASEIVRALIEGPKTDLVRTLPEQTKLLGVKIEKGTALVDFDQELIEQHPGGSASEMATIYSLANSLTMNIPEIKSVRILINGKSRPTLKGHMDTERAFTVNKEMIQTPSGE